MIFGQGTTLDTGQVTQLFGHVTIVLPLIFGHIPQQHHGILGSNLEYHENNISELWYSIYQKLWYLIPLLYNGPDSSKGTTTDQIAENL